MSCAFFRNVLGQYSGYLIQPSLRTRPINHGESSWLRPMRRARRALPEVVRSADSASLFMVVDAGKKNGKPCPSLPNDRDSRTTSCSIRRWSVLRRGSSPILLFVCLHFLLQTRSRSDQVKKVASGANLYTDLALGDSACSFVNLSRLATLRENRLTSWQKHKFLTSCGLFQFSLGSSEPRRWWRRLSWPGEQTWKTKSVIIKSLKREKTTE